MQKNASFYHSIAIDRQIKQPDIKKPAEAGFLISALGVKHAQALW